MANERIPEDPYRFGRDVDYRSSRFDRDPPDRGYDAAPPSSGKVTLFAIGIAIVLGAVFYSLNTTSLKNAPDTPPTQSAQSQPPTSPRAPPGMREMTPRAANSAPGTTTGTAPAQPAIPPATAPENMSRNPPANK